MNAKTSHPLSDYQNAILKELGIVVWQTQPADLAQKKDVHVQDTQGSSSTVKPISALNSKDSGKKSTAMPDSIRQFKSHQEPTKSLKAAPNHLLFEFDTNKVNPTVLEDIIRSLGFDDKKYIRLANTACGEYSDYVLGWKVGDDFQLKDNVLVTPPLGLSVSGDYKKRLWSLISSLRDE